MNISNMNINGQAIKRLDEQYNIEASNDQVDAVLEALDETGKKWLETASVQEVADYVVGILCNTLPDRDGNF